MEWLNEHVLWWHWIIVGILFLIAEIFTNTFIMLWLGVAAIVVGGVEYFFHPSFDVLLYLWTGLSVALLFVWFGYFKRTPRSHVGQAEGEYVHIKGEVVEKLGKRRYRAEFELPVLGDRSWIVEADEPLEKGDRVEVVKVYGQILKVRKVER